MIRAFCVLYVGLALLLMDFGRWGDAPFLGVFAAVHIVLGLTLSLRTRRGPPAQWLGLVFILFSFSVTVGFASDPWFFSRLGLSLDIDLAHMAVAAGAFLHFAKNFGTSPERIRERRNRKLYRLDQNPVLLGIVIGGTYWGLMSQVTWRSLEPLMFAWMAVAFMLGARHLYLNHRTADQEHKLRIKWALLAGVTWMAASAIFFVVIVSWSLGFWFPWMTVGVPVQQGAALLWTIGSSLLVYGMLTHGTIDPSFAIRKTTVFASLGVLFLFLLAGFGNLAENWLEGGLGLPSGIGTVLTGGTLAIVLIPVKRRLGVFVNRILPATVLAEAPTQTVAILFTDIVGYTRLTGEDQNAALTLISVFHKVVDRLAREHKGRW
ncbi:hypothetical protein ACFL3Z_01480 [Gemmatimonadota bacterium]